jgi:hypothetical protein
MAPAPPADLVVRQIAIVDVANGQTRSNQRVLVRSDWERLRRGG